MNLLFRYANETNLLVAENTHVDLADEFSNIREWSIVTVWLSRFINLHKTKEIVLHRPHSRRRSLLNRCSQPNYLEL